MFRGIAELYQRLADDREGSREEIDALAEFFARDGRANPR
jgi:hypothetical protein